MRTSLISRLQALTDYRSNGKDPSRRRASGARRDRVSPVLWSCSIAYASSLKKPVSEAITAFDQVLCRTLCVLLEVSAKE